MMVIIKQMFDLTSQMITYVSFRHPSHRLSKTMNKRGRGGSGSLWDGGMDHCGFRLSPRKTGRRRADGSEGPPRDND